MGSKASKHLLAVRKSVERISGRRSGVAAHLLGRSPEGWRRPQCPELCPLLSAMERHRAPLRASDHWATRLGGRCSIFRDAATLAGANGTYRHASTDSALLR